MTKWYTKSQIVIQRPKDQVFDAVVLACKKHLKAKVKSADKTKYEIVAKNPTSWIHNRFPSNMRIFLSDELEQGGSSTLLDVYDDFINTAPGHPDADVMQRFFNALAKTGIPFTTNFSVEVVSEIRPGESRNMELVCTNCVKNIFSFVFKGEKLCMPCFEERYGSIILRGNGAYYGGHKAFLAGGIISEQQYGPMLLTDSHLIFEKQDKDPLKKWEIIIPLASVVVDRWRIEEVKRRSQITGGGGGIDIIDGGDSRESDFALGGGFIHDSGKAHHIVIPYIDENGIPQEPRFGISSLGGKAIREWSAKIYERVVEAFAS
jgi:hypothetical protein